MFVRHGESTWNDANRFTGWHDVPLSAAGEAQALQAARAVQGANVCFDAVFTSTLKRTIKTAWIMLEQMDAFTLPVEKAWQLNERMYGALTGLNKADTRAAIGDDAFEELRKVPPPIGADSCFDPSRRSRFADVPREALPVAESFEDTRDRVMPYWRDVILPRALEGETVLVISSKNLLRALLMGISSHVPTEQLVDLEIPNGVPLVFEPRSGQLTPLEEPQGPAEDGGAAAAPVLAGSVWEALAAGPGHLMAEE